MRPYETDYDAIIEIIEAGSRVYRDEFKAAEAAGMFAPHLLREDGAGAFCEDCDLAVLFITDAKGAVAEPPTCEICEEQVASTKAKYVEALVCADCAATEPCPECGLGLDEHSGQGCTVASCGHAGGITVAVGGFKLCAGCYQAMREEICS